MWELIDYKHKKVIDKLPVQYKKKYAVFKYIAEKSGLSGLASMPGFNLEMLKGTLAGFYSIRLNIAYRVVFAVQEQIKVIRILEISKHKYNY